MANLSLKHIYKVYKNGTKAVNDFNLDIEDQEFVVFVGPSGCGKSTTLRMIAGLEEITSGELRIGDAVVNELEPKDRDIAMVFQNYALYPHMSIYENIAFGLQTRKVPKDIIDKKVKEVASTLGITEYLDRKPKEMSGGQRHRVALGRAIVREPKVMLLDEPLSNLDAKLRAQMRSEIVKLHKKLKTTFIYVTHDQVEAMTMGTRIVVMKDGFIKQVDTPKNLYNYPANLFVAGFIGTPQMNFFDAYLEKENDELKVRLFGDLSSFVADSKYFSKVPIDYLKGNKKVVIGVRSEHLSFVKNNDYPSFKVKISHFEELGNETLAYCDLDLSDEEKIESKTKVIVKISGFTTFKSGEIRDVYISPEMIHIFDEESGESILKRIPDNNQLEVETKGNAINLDTFNIKLPPVINLKDAKYKLIIPTSAISFGSTYNANVISKEEIDNKFLYLIKLGKENLYFISTKNIDESIIKIDIDFTQLSIERDGEIVVKELANKNVFEGRYILRKGKGKLFNYEREYLLKIDDYSFKVIDKISNSLNNSFDGRKVFNFDYLIKVKPEDIVIGEEGIETQVEEILDYSKKKYAKCLYKNDYVYVLIKEEIKDKIHISFNQDNLEIFEKEKEIQLV